MPMTAHDFLNVFKLRERADYERATVFSNKVGFSVQRRYPESSCYKPATIADGTPDSVAIIRVVYDSRGDTADEQIVPLLIRVHLYRRYSNDHMEYDYDDPLCPTKESIAASQQTPEPLGLAFDHDFSYNNNTGKFYNNKQAEFSGIGILDFVFKEHCATVDEPRGIKFRKKIDRYMRYARWIVIVNNFLVLILKKLFGREISPKDPFRMVWEGIKAEDISAPKKEVIDLFGYKAGKPVILLFCISVLLFYFLYRIFDLHIHSLKYLAENSLLALCVSLVFLWIIDVVIPKTICIFMRLLFRLRTKLENQQYIFK